MIAVKEEVKILETNDKQRVRQEIYAIRKFLNLECTPDKLNVIDQRPGIKKQYKFD